MVKKYNDNPTSADKAGFNTTDRIVFFQASTQVVKLSYPAHFTDPDATSASRSVSLIKVFTIGTDGTEIPVTFERCDRDGNSRNDSNDIQVAAELLANVSRANIEPNIANYIKLTRPRDSSGNVISGNLKVTIEYPRAVMGIEEDEKGSVYDGEMYSHLPYSAALMKNLLDRVRVLENTTNIGSLFGTSLATSDILDEDLTGAAPENYVRYERHEVNTYADVTLVQPAKGSFYPMDLEVLVFDPVPYTLVKDDTESINGALDQLFFYTDTESIVNGGGHASYQHRAILTRSVITRLLSKADSITGTLIRISGANPVKKLTLGVDYELDSIDIARTARSSSPNAVYQNIRFITPRNGEVLVSYRAFGGFAAAEDIRAIHQDVTNTKQLLTSAGLVTQTTLDAHPFLKALYKRLTRMEEYHAHNSQVEHRIGIGTPGFHWINIAVVYDKAWGIQAPVINDVGTFRVQSTLRKWVYEFSVDLDMTRPSDSIIKIRTIGTNQDSYTDFKDYTRILFRDNLAARMCWIDDGKVSGLVLQVGWDFTPYITGNYAATYGIAQDNILVTNKSGASSMWSLLTDPDQVNYPANGSVSVYQHSKFNPTEDTEYQAGKQYWSYKDLYMYRRTADTTIKEGKPYYEYNAAAADGAGYYPIESGSSIYAPGTPTSNFLVDVVDGSGNKIGTQVNLFERIMFGKYPVKEPPVYASADDAPDGVEVYRIAGTSITGSLYEESDATYDPDTSFTMPDGSIWTYGVDNSCTKFIEPDGGVVAWLGNVNLTPYAYGEATCKKCDTQDYTAATDPDYDVSQYNEDASTYRSELMFSGYLQSLIDVKSVTKATLVLFDRLSNVYVTVSGDMSMSCAEEDTRSAEITICLSDMCFCKFSLKKLPVVAGSYNNKQYAQDVAVVDRSGIASLKYLNPAADVTGMIQMSITPVFGSLSRDTERFDLRQVRLHF